MSSQKATDETQKVSKLEENDIIRTVQRKLMPLPPDFPKLRRDDNLEILPIAAKKPLMVRILNRQMIAPLKIYREKYDSGSTLASKLAGVNAQEKLFNAKDFENFFLPADDTLELYVAALESDVPLEVITKYPGSIQLYGTNYAPDLRWTQDVSDKCNPTILLPVIADKHEPQFTFANPKRTIAISPRWVALWLAGMTFSYEPLTGTAEDEARRKPYSRLPIQPVVVGGD